MSHQHRGTTSVAALLAASLALLGLSTAGAAAVPLRATAGPAPAAAAAVDTTPGSISLAVKSARTVGGPGTVQKGDPVTTYAWLVNADDTGNPGTAASPLTEKCLPATAAGGSADPAYADTCPWPSTRPTSSAAPIIAQGTQADLGGASKLDGLAPGKYLISVTADGFKIDGSHFTVAPGGTRQVTVEMQPTPLPLTTLKIEVFNDNAPVDATYEVAAEQGLAGFTAHLADVFGTVSVDYYGNSLCTVYQHVGGIATNPIVIDPVTNKPVVNTAQTTGRCVSDVNGVITIPNMGPNRYASTVTPPVPAVGQTSTWVQTTSLEGGHDHDIWSQEGATGFDNEVTKGAELVPMVQFGFVRTQSLPATASVTGEVKGRVMAGLPYIGGQNGIVGPEGLAGTKLGGPIKAPWLALSDLNRGDAQVFVGQGADDGTFDIKNVPNGSYQLTLWDDTQDYILTSFNVEVTGGQPTDLGVKTLVGWFTHLQGTIFVDANGNGVKDPGEAGVPNFTLSVRERDNSTMDQGLNTVVTDANGHYDIREVYPLGKFLVLEAFNTRYQTTGVTYKGDNDPTPTTKLGGLVDLDFLAIIGLGGTVDWGVQPYARGSNGGIVGTVSYDTTRNELDPAAAATESYQPGVPNIPVNLYQPAPCTATDPVIVANTCRQGYQIVPLQVPDPLDATKQIDNPATDRGAMVKGMNGAPLNTTTSETWAAPRGCTARMWDGNPLTDQQALPAPGPAANQLCVEAPMMGVAIGASDTSNPASASQTVNGNYGFSTSKVNLYAPGDPNNPAPAHDLALGADLAGAGYPEQDLPAADYIVDVAIPDNPVPAGGHASKMYKVTSEADVNVFSGDAYLPQENFPPSAAQASNTPNPPAKSPTQPSQPPSQQAGIISACVGALHAVHVTNADFLANGGSPFEGYARPSCQDKLVTVRAGQATAPNFHLFTDVPIPTHFWGLTLNDLGVTLDKRSVNYGEAQGMPYVPVGLYDWSGRLVDTVHTDFNGLYEGLEPSTSTYNCPVPAGPCPNMYRFVGNDPGAPGALNPDYNPRFRTIAATFQGWPGLYTVTDEAPTQVAATVLTPDTTVANNTVCDLPGDVPQLFAVDKPTVRLSDTVAQRTVTMKGKGFGAAAGTLKVGSTPVAATSWSDTQIVFTVTSAPGVQAGAQPVSITGSNSRTAYNSLTLQVLSGMAGTAVGTRGNPALFEVGPGRPYATIQAAVNAARPTSDRLHNLVVVYPGAPTSNTPRGEYLENVLVNNRIRIQGVGPGGWQSPTAWVPGSIIDGSGFNPDNAIGASWLTTLTGMRYTGTPAVPDAAVVTFLNNPATPADLTTDKIWQPSLDGFQVTGGIQSDFAGNVNIITGGIKTPYGATGALVTQGGGVYVHHGVKGLQLTDNLIVGNGGSYAGGIRVGTPYAGDNGNANLTIARNQVRDNGGTNLAGGIGLFTGSNGYDVENNAICGNHSSEYGGGISAFGFMGDGAKDGGTIAHNRIWFNQSYDEGGGVMVAGELPSVPTALSPGSGPVTIDANVIQANLANDDGGGIRLLQVSGSQFTKARPGTISITNNTIANNVSAHEGGGLALDDAVFVNIVNNTVTKNLTTATAVTSNGQPAPAGLSTAAISVPLQARLDSLFTTPLTGLNPTTNNNLLTGSSTRLGFSRPTLLNDVFWDNRAGTYVGGYVRGIGGKLPDGTDNTTTNWDMGVVDVPGSLSPVSSVLQTTSGTDVNPLAPGTNRISAANPGLLSPYDVSVNVLPLRSYPAFRQAAIVTTVLPFELLGDYHLAAGSPAYGLGSAGYNVVWNNPGSRPGAYQYVVPAPVSDIDGNPRPPAAPVPARFDAGSDQVLP